MKYNDSVKQMLVLVKQIMIAKETKMTEKMTITVKEMAEMLNVSLPTAYDLVHSEGFPTIRIGRKLLVNSVMLQDWINAHTCSRG